jgi:tetratricopeptide (TPR) repeat protein
VDTPDRDRSRASRVRWLGRAEAGVEAQVKDQFTAELDHLFDEPGVQEITVHNVFAGYSNEQATKVVLGVEVRSTDRYDTHIVKLGATEAAKPDYDGWRACAGNRYVGSRIFVRLQAKELEGGRAAVVYEDAYTLFGLDPKTQQPEFLEDVINWAVLDDKPDPASVERVLCQIYGDLFRWFYYASKPAAAAAKTFYDHRLRGARPKWEPPGSAHLNDLRQDVTWLLGGLDPPDSDAPAVYLDPYDYVRWALENEQIPPTLVGCSHGDLHGRNVLVAVRRGEAEFPIVIDYGEMSPANVLVWDFAKLETEIKVRLLPRMFQDPEVVAALLSSRGDQPPRSEFSNSRVRLGPDENHRAVRARRLAVAFEFESLLALATRRIDGEMAAESRQPPGGRPVFAQNRKIDRALTILLRIRQEAALWLGYRKAGRHTHWCEELLFALGVYGLSAAKWDTYEPQNTECALVSAGVALAQMEQAQFTLDAQRKATGVPPRNGPSYRCPLASAHRRLDSGRIAEARTQVEAAMQDYPHAVPLRTEYALILAEMGDLSQALTIVDPLRRLCWVFGDHETLTRIGRAFKNLGDREWEKLGPPYRALPRDTPAWQYFQESLNLYRDAYEISRGHYFPGANLVTLTLLIGDRAKAREYAEKVLATCLTQQLEARGQERYWLFASEGEAVLGSGRTNRANLARDFYASALACVGPGEIRLVQSAWNQLCRLRCVLDPSVVAPVVQAFRDRTELWSILGRGPLGDCDLGGRR